MNEQKVSLKKKEISIKKIGFIFILIIAVSQLPFILINMFPVVFYLHDYSCTKHFPSAEAEVIETYYLDEDGKPLEPYEMNENYHVTPTGVYSFQADGRNYTARNTYDEQYVYRKDGTEMCRIWYNPNNPEQIVTEASLDVSGDAAKSFFGTYAIVTGIGIFPFVLFGLLIKTKQRRRQSDEETI